MPIKVGIVLIFTPFNFAVLFSLQNEGHTNITGLTVRPGGEIKQSVYLILLCWGK